MKKKLAIFTAAVGFFTLCNVVLYTRKLRSDEMAHFWHWSALTAATNCSGPPGGSDDPCTNSSATTTNFSTIEMNGTAHRRQHHRDIRPDMPDHVGPLPDRAGAPSGGTSSVTPAPGKPVPPPGTVTAPGVAVTSTGSSTSTKTFPVTTDIRKSSGDPQPRQSSTVALDVPPPPPTPAPLQQPSRARHRQQQFVLDNRTFYIADGTEAEVHLPVSLPGNRTVKVTFGVSLLDDVVANAAVATSTARTEVTTPTGITYRLGNATSLPAGKAVTTTVATTNGLTILNQHPFRYLIDVQDQCNGGQVTLLILVATSISHFENRQAIRDTWGSIARSGALGVRLVFVMGRPADPTLEPAVVREAIRHADIVQEDFLDTYKNLTLKTMMILKWAHSHCPHARYIMKSDDDMFINVPNLIRYIRNLRQSKSQLFGRLVKGARPLRSKASKYFVPVADYRGHVYPEYLSGTAYVMSSDVAPRLLAVAQKTPIFFFEDVFITGTCAKRAGIVRRNHMGFAYHKRGVTGCAYVKVISGHNHTPKELRTIWKELQKKTLKC